MIHSRLQTEQPSKTHVLWIVLFALVLRVVYLPLHLAQEEHFGVLGQPVTHTDHEHSDHEHDEDHAPHAELDHKCELIEERTATLETHVATLALPSDETDLLRAFSSSTAATRSEPWPPDSRPRDATRTRGPPALS